MDNEAKPDYKPISCDFYDELEAASTLNQRCDIVYRDENGGQQNVISRIEDLYIENGVEMARLEENQTIRLDRIVTVNDKPARITRTQAKKTYLDLPGFYASETSFTVAQTDFYRLIAYRDTNILELESYKRWYGFAEVPELDEQMEAVARAFGSAFSLLNNITALPLDERMELIAPPIPGRAALLNAGLSRVADLVPQYCQAVLHGLNGFSINSLDLRSFTDRIPAEHWLSETT